MKRVLVGCGVVLLLLVALGVGSLLWLKHQLSSPMAPPGAPTVELAVAKGVTGRGLGPQLVSQGLVRSPFLWHWSLKLRGNFSPKAGRHVVSPSMTMDELASALEGPPLPEDIAFSIIEGWRLRDTDAALSAAGYLCWRGKNLAKPRGWMDALRAYNLSDQYARTVRDWATAYAEGHTL